VKRVAFVFWSVVVNWSERLPDDLLTDACSSWPSTVQTVAPFPEHIVIVTQHGFRRYWGNTLEDGEENLRTGNVTKADKIGFL
jgi:hypothetical protein